MKVFLIVWALIMTVALVCSLVLWHPWNPPEAPQPESAVSEQQLKDFYDRGFDAGYKRGSLPEAIAGQQSLMNSKLVNDVTVNVGLVLKGTLVKVSLVDETIVLQADGDNRTVYMEENTKMARWLEEEGRTEYEAIDMKEIESYLGKPITVVAWIRGETLGCDTVFLWDTEVRLD